jgi:hypothetical protein
VKLSVKLFMARCSLKCSAVALSLWVPKGGQ